MAIISVLLALNLTGYAKQKFWQQKLSTQGTRLKSLVVQGNIGNTQKLYAEYGRGFNSIIANEYFSLTRTGLRDHPETDLIIWPETAYPEILDSNARVFDQFVLSINKPILTGAYSREFLENSMKKDYNALFLLNSQAQRLSAIAKTYLLIFGETIPFVEQFPG